MHARECGARSKGTGYKSLFFSTATPLERKAGALDAAPMEPIHSRSFTRIGSLSRLANLCLASDLHGSAENSTASCCAHGVILRPLAHRAAAAAARTWHALPTAALL